MAGSLSLRVASAAAPGGRLLVPVERWTGRATGPRRPSRPSPPGSTSDLHDGAGL